MSNSQEMEKALGLPVYVNEFADKIPRLCYPFKLKDLTRLNSYLSTIDENNLEPNVKSENSFVILVSLLKESFRDVENDMELMEQITVENYPSIISAIKDATGISTNKGDIDIDKTIESSSLDWATAVNSIQVYTANTYHDIQEMTLRQFNELVSYVGVVINWQYKTGILASVSEPENFLPPHEHPLASHKQEKESSKKMMTMKDFAQLQNM